MPGSHGPGGAARESACKPLAKQNLGAGGLCLTAQEIWRGTPQNRRFRGAKFGWFAYYCWAAGLIVLALTLVLG